VGANFNFYLLAVYYQSFGLQVGLPHLTRVALRKADVVAVLLTLFIKIKSLHRSLFYWLAEVLATQFRPEKLLDKRVKKYYNNLPMHIGYAESVADLTQGGA